MKDDRDMGCEQAKDKLEDWLHNDLDKADRNNVERHLAECGNCREEFAADKQLWESLGKMKVPEPREEMRVSFYAMLDDFKAAEETSKPFSFQALFEKLREFVLPQWTIQIAFSLLLVGLGWVIGHKTSKNNVSATAYQAQIETLATQVEEMKSTMMLALIENPSATERLRAVGYTSDITHADDKVINALFTTLNNDANVNVRLVALEALTQFATDAVVREGLVKSLAVQDSPMVQVALADVMVKLQEKGSVKELRKLLNREGLNDLVKNKIEQTIKELS
ncbi:zf-HC2 domain-containing protein [Dyadobacter sp. LJ53]|uniref:zf-HC2 domain-containing protein n=1 Tax=Dyadobacter chenwenxiniae TaxID=2906456 RepID=UPI001F3AAA4B|nr:zf-HC2 domain-containing protein [Dyadobacter chenwenxiniae]MCF0050859.1 zf-HC2 domain-containing protein [Dyadobacter chenwenxiniae]